MIANGHETKNQNHDLNELCKDLNHTMFLFIFLDVKYIRWSSAIAVLLMYLLILNVNNKIAWTRFTDRSRAAATSKMELFVTIGYGWKPLQTIETKSSISDVVAAVDPDLRSINPFQPSVTLLYPLKTEVF